MFDINGDWHAEKDYSKLHINEWCIKDYIANAIIKDSYIPKTSIETLVLCICSRFKKYQKEHENPYKYNVTGYFQFIEDHGGYEAFDYSTPEIEAKLPTTNVPRAKRISPLDVAPNPNVPRCPTCQSTNIEKVKLAKKLLSIELLGLASNKIGKQFKCKNCGYYW